MTATTTTRERSLAIADVSWDAFGRDRALVARMGPLLDRLLDDVFGIVVDGKEHLPKDGPVILVANHGGALPWDALVLLRLVERERNRALRPLLEDAVMSAPFLGTLLNKMGAVRASQENALRLLARDEAVAVFPEGMLGLSKEIRHRYQLMRFGRGGFVRLALRAKAPIVPVAVVGAEDAAPLLTKIQFLLKGTLVPYLPVTPLFPLLGPAGLLPLPAQWAVRFLPPVDVVSEIDDEEDAAGIGDLAHGIRAHIQAHVDELVAARPSRYRFRLPWRR